MARKAREKSELGIYLVNLKSVDEVTFSSDDKINYLNILLKNKTKLLGYTLLDNSFLLVIKEDDRAIELILRQTTIKFVKKFNRTNNRQGKVFSGRYTSYPAHTMNDVWKFISNTHKLAVINNENLSSINNYFDNVYVDSNYSLRFFESKSEFEEVCSGKMFTDSGIKLSDEDIKNYIINTFQIQPHNISKMPQTLLDSTIYEIFKATKASARQIARITSLPLRLLWKIGKKLKPKSKSKPMVVVKNESNNK